MKKKHPFHSRFTLCCKKQKHSCSVQQSSELRNRFVARGRERSIVMLRHSVECGKETFWFLLIFLILDSSPVFAAGTQPGNCSATNDPSMLLGIRAGKPPRSWFRTFCDLWRCVVAAKQSNRVKVRADPHSQLPPTNSSNSRRQFAKVVIFFQKLFKQRLSESES